jgi:hypothetical protein
MEEFNASFLHSFTNNGWETTQKLSQIPRKTIAAEATIH